MTKAVKILAGQIVATLALAAPSALAVTVYGEAELRADDAEEGDFLGDGVALSGDTVLVGAWGVDDVGGNAGAVYVFVRNGDSWEQEAKLLADDGVAYDEFGREVALDGDTALVGVKVHDAVGDASGACYVFTRTSGVWTQEAKLVPDDAHAGDRFGSAVALEGGIALIGAMTDEGQGELSGAAYVFVRAGGVWTQQAKLQAADGGAENTFGRSVDLEGDTAMIGARGVDGAAAGAVYVFTLTAGVWTQQAKLLASDGTDGDGFGVDVSIDDGTALIGAAWSDDSADNSGSAYVFALGAEGWVEEAKLLASDGGNNWAMFGRDLVLHRNIAIIAADGNASLGSQSGAVYVFSREGGVWAEQAKLTAWDGDTGDRFGSGVAFEGTTAIVGAWAHDHGIFASGSAYVFRVFGDGVPATSAAGLVVLVLAMLGVSSYLLKRQGRRRPRFHRWKSITRGNAALSSATRFPPAR